MEKIFSFKHHAFFSLRSALKMLIELVQGKIGSESRNKFEENASLCSVSPQTRP